MSHLDSELHVLKEQLIEMQRLVRSQISKGKGAFFHFDHDQAREVLDGEKAINNLELKIDRHCENVLALFNPVAIDLRFVLAALKINSNLERIGDNAEGIARYILDVQHPFDPELIEAYKIEDMYKSTLSMMDDTLNAFINEDTSLARKVFQQDDILDAINRGATQTTIRFIESRHRDPMHYLNTLSIIRKLERVGDQAKNVAEEIVFYLEAKVLKHGPSDNPG